MRHLPSWMGASARTHQADAQVCRISGCTHTKLVSLHGPRYSPINICTWGYREISWKRAAHPFFPRFLDQIPLSRSRILVLYGVCITPFVRMCAWGSYNRGEGRGRGMLEYLRWPRKIWYSGGGIVGMVFGRNFTETNASWVGERGLIAQMGKIWDKLERIGWRSELLGEWMRRRC